MEGDRLALAVVVGREDRSSDPFRAFFSSATCRFESSGTWYVTRNSRSTSTPSSLFGRSRMWP